MLPPKSTRFRSSLACLVLTLAAAPGLAADAARTDVHGDPLPDGAVARAGTVRWRAGAPIALSAFLADGKSVLTVAQDHVAQVWDAATGQELRRFDVSGGETGNTPAAASRRYFSPVLRGVAASADGKTLAVTGKDGVVRVWDVATGKEQARLARHEDPGFGGPQLDTLTLSRDGKLLARTSFNQRTTVHDATNGKALKQFGEAAAPAPGPGGRGVRSLPYRTEFGPNGKTMLLITAERDGAGAMKMVLVIWDVENAKQLKRYDEWPTPAGAGPGGRGVTLIVAAVSPDHKLAALPLDAKTIVLFDPVAGKEARRIEGAGDGRRGTLAFTADSKSLVVVPGTGESASVCDVASGKVTKGEGRTEATAPLTPPAIAPAVRAPAALARGGRTFALSDDGKWFTSSEGPTLHLIDVATGKDRNTTTGHTAALRDVFFSADGKTLLTLSADASARRWDAATGKAAGALASARPGPARGRGAAIALSPDGKVWALSDYEGQVVLVDVATGKDLHTLKPDGGEVPAAGALGVNCRFAVFSPDSRTVAVANSEESKVRLYDVASGLSKRELLLPNMPEDQDFSPQRSVFFSPDGRLVAVSDVGLHLWEAATGKELRMLTIREGTSFRNAIFSPDGRTLAMLLSDGEIQVVELASGKPRLVLKRETRPKTDPDLGPLPPVMRRALLVGAAEPASLAIAPDGRLLAHAGEDGKVHLWDLRTGKEAAPLSGNRGQLTAVAFSPDGKRLATGSTDTTALIWDAEAVCKKLPNQAAPLAREKVEALWEGLVGGDAGRAYEAVCGLAGDPARTVPLLRERLKPAVAADAKLLARLVADLDADEFDTREKAKKELARLGESAAGALREALKNKPSAEKKRTIDDHLAGHGGATPSDDRVQVMRALETLEMIGTPEAVAVLKSLAGGSPDAFLTIQAKAALDRLRK